MALALRLGRTLHELCETMSAKEFSLWLQFHQDSPIDDSRGDMQAGIIAAQIVNYAGKIRADTIPPARPIDFMPFVEKPELPSNDDDPLAFFRNL